MQATACKIEYPDLQMNGCFKVRKSSVQSCKQFYYFSMLHSPQLYWLEIFSQHNSAFLNYKQGWYNYLDLIGPLKIYNGVIHREL